MHDFFVHQAWWKSRVLDVVFITNLIVVKIVTLPDDYHFNLQRIWQY
jgi:hypothetical protein